MNKKTILDANAILRLLLDDVHVQCDTVKEIIESNDCFCVLSTIQEVVYVLEGYYEISRKEIKEKLIELSRVMEIEDEDIFVSAFQYYTETPKIDFADCIMCGYKKNRDVDVLTFDHKLQKKLKTI